MNRGKALVAVLAAAVVAVGCGKKPTLGVVLARTGAAAPYGLSMERAMRLALTEAKTDGTAPAGLEVLWADSGSDAQRAADEARRLAHEGAELLLAGVTSGEAKAILPVLEETHMVCISPSASAPMLTKRSKLFFRLFPSDELEGSAAARFLIDRMGKRSVIIFSEDTEHSRGIEPQFRQVYEQVLGGKVVGRIVVGDPGWKRQAADLLVASQPEAAYVVAYADATVAALELLEAQRYRGPVLATSAISSGEVIAKHAKLFDGVFFPQPTFDLDDPRKEVQAFVAAYRKMYGADPDIYAAHAYDAMRLALKVLADTRTLTAEELKKTLHFGLENYVGVTGPIQFDDYGDVRRNPIMYIIKDGRVIRYKKYVDRLLKDIGRRFGAG